MTKIQKHNDRPLKRRKSREYIKKKMLNNYNKLKFKTDASRVFPKILDAKYFLQQEKLEVNECLYAMDYEFIPKGSTTSVQSKKFIVFYNGVDGIFEYLFKGKINKESRVYYEILTEGKPLKLFFDIDIPYTDGKGEKYYTDLFDEFIVHLNSAISELFNKYKLLAEHPMPDLNPIILKSYNEHSKKFSRHIIYDFCLFKNNTHLENFVKYLLCILKEKLEGTKFLHIGSNKKVNVFGIDTSVYHRNKQFRLPYNKKIGNNKPHLCIEKYDEEIADEEKLRNIFYKSLISNNIIIDSEDSNESYPKYFSKFLPRQIISYEHTHISEKTATDILNFNSSYEKTTTKTNRDNFSIKKIPTNCDMFSSDEITTMVKGLDEFGFKKLKNEIGLSEYYEIKPGRIQFFETKNENTGDVSLNLQLHMSGVKCPKKGRCHRNNLVYFHLLGINKLKKSDGNINRAAKILGRFVCQDKDECACSITGKYYSWFPEHWDPKSNRKFKRKINFTYALRRGLEVYYK